MTKLSAESYAIIEGRHSDPFHYLGLHTEGGKTVARALPPETWNVQAIDEHGETASLVPIHHAEDWNFPEGRFLAYVLGPIEHGQAPIFIVLNAAPEAIAFKLPKMPEYKSWQQLVNTADSKQTAADFASWSKAKASPRAVLASAGWA